MAKEINDNMKININPKVVIFLSLGGYSGEKTSENKQNAKNVAESLIDYMQRNKVGIVCIDNQLCFVEITITS